MKAFRSVLGTTTLCGAAAVAGILGYNMVENVQFAHAQQQVEASRQQLSQAEDLATVFRTVGKTVEPSVVSIEVHKKIKGVANAHQFFDDPQLRRFFDRDGDGQPDIPFGNPNGDGGDDSMEQVGTGSGVIMEVNGSTAYILTNNHVAGGAEEMTVTLSDGRKITKAKTLGADPKTDLAVVEITADRLIPAKWGNSDELQKGDWVLAFGSPFGYVGSMTHGIISALNRTDVGILASVGGYENFIQVDAPINPGNSGGPLVNLHGEVVGINTAIASRSGGFQGIGFTIPSNMAKYVYAQLKDKGKVTRGWLGVSIADANDPRVQPVVKSFGYTKDKGVLVQQTMPNTPATGKLKEGDIVTAVDGKPVENAIQLRNAIAKVAPHTEVDLTVFRDGKSQDVKINVGEQPENLASIRNGEGGGRRNRGGDNADSGTASLDKLGLQLGDLNDQRAERLGLQSGTKGAVVLRVEPRSAAAKAGLTPGAVITRVGGQTVNNAEEADAALSKANLDKGVRLYVTDQIGSHFTFLSTAKDDSGND